MQRILKIVLLIYEVISINNYCNAIELNGYIINSAQDTVYGKIKLNRFSPTTGALYLNGFDLESLSYRIEFKNDSDKSYQTFLPNTILEYGFEYNSCMYIYRSFLLKYNSISAKERTKYKFLRLIYHGSLDLYKNINHLNIPTNIITVNNLATYYEYFLVGTSAKTLKVERSNQIRTVRDLLRQFNVYEEYVQEIPENTKFKDIKTVLEIYDRWLSIHHPNTVKL
ncbi:MAG: hypothetical protein H6537_02805 [Bacteroidales bacterium]|nr:hypothetical protein [Bacteroidales bacterium]